MSKPTFGRRGGLKRVGSHAHAHLVIKCGLAGPLPIHNAQRKLLLRRIWEEANHLLRPAVIFVLIAVMQAAAVAGEIAVGHFCISG